MKRSIWAGVLFAGALLSACQSTEPLEGPPNNPNPIVLPTVASSVINIPIDIDLERVRVETLKNIPKPLSAGTTNQTLVIANTRLPLEANITHMVNLRDVRLSVIGQDFLAKAELDFSIDTHMRASVLNMGGVSCGIGEALPKIEFTLPGKLYWTTEGDLALQPGQWQIKWLKPCNITAFKLNVEQLLNLPLVRNKVQTLVNDNINASLKQVGLKAMLAKSWPQMLAPQEIDKNVWLLLQPEKIGLTDIAGLGRYVKTSVSVTVRPQIVTGDKPKLSLAQMPNPQRLTTPAEGFNLALRGDIGLDVANRLLNEKLANKPFDANGRQVLITSLNLYGSGDNTVLALKLKQPIDAEIYLLAKPILDVEKNELRLENVDFALSTSDFLAASANWLLHSTFKDTIKEKARFSFDNDLADTLKQFKDYRQNLGYGATLKAQVARVRPQGVYFTTTDIKAFVVVEGKLGLEVAN